MQGNIKLLKIQGLLHFRIYLRTAPCLRKNVAKLQSENFGTTKSVSGGKMSLVSTSRADFHSIIMGRVLHR